MINSVRTTPVGLTGTAISQPPGIDALILAIERVGL
jgi:hypothetical protein